MLRVEAPPGAEPGRGHVRLPRVDSRADCPRRPLQRLRPRRPHRQRRRAQEPAHGVVQGDREGRELRGRREPGLPRSAAGLRQLPPPPLREVVAGRLLGPRGVLRPRRPQGHPSAGWRRQPGQPASRSGVQPRHRVGASTSAPARPPTSSRSMATRWRSPPKIDPRQKLVDWMVDPEEPVLRQGSRQPLLGALLRPRHRRPARRHARHQPALEPGTARTRWPRT